MTTSKVYPVPQDLAKHAHIDQARYQDMYRQSIEDPQGFWAEQAEQFLSWDRKWDKVWEWDYHEANIKWFEGATLNASYNCLDARRSGRHHLGRR
jgi:acetyl-CoA synthetase